MSAYLVFTREATLDVAELTAYSQQAPVTLAGHPAKVLTFYGDYEVLEGADTEGAVILEFPSMAAARDWYHSPGYVAAREHRLKGATYRVLLVDGVGSAGH